jgi:hypothetical protein
MRDGPKEPSVDALFHAEDELDRASGDLYFEDGNDIGGGTFNVYLYTQRIDATVQKIIELERLGRIPAGARIGVAQYSNAQRTDWTYKPVWPAGLKSFDITYGADPAR